MPVTHNFFLSSYLVSTFLGWVTFKEDYNSEKEEDDDDYYGAVGEAKRNVRT